MIKFEIQGNDNGTTEPQRLNGSKDEEQIQTISSTQVETDIGTYQMEGI